MRFTLEIEMGNQAMQTRNDIEWALRKLGQNVGYMSETPEDGDEGTVKDENGNKVGEWRIAER